MSLAILTKSIIIFGLISTMGFAAWSGDPASLAWWKGGFIILVALVVPFFLFWLMQSKMVHNNTQQWILLVSAALYSLGGLVLTYKALIEDPGAQSGLVMVVIPVYGSALIVLTTIVLLFAKKW